MKRDPIPDLGWKPAAKPQFGVIERGIPVPAKRAAGRYAALAEQMQPGDSVLLETKAQAVVLQQVLRKAGHTTRRAEVDGGHRVWRTE